MQRSPRCFPLAFAPCVLVAGLVLGTARDARALINLGGFGGGVGGIGTIDPTQPPTGGGGGPPAMTVDFLEAHGYTCEPGHMAEVECRACGFEPVSETQECEVQLCPSSGTCSDHRVRWNVPVEVNGDEYRMWAKEFAWGASNYFIADFNGDGRRDLGAQEGDGVHVALSRGTYFEDVGIWTGTVPFESQGPNAALDVNGDGFVDTLSVAASGDLVVGISNGSGAAASIDLPSTWCARIGDCLIGDVNGDGRPDLIEVMRGAISLDRAGDVWVSLGTDISGFPHLPDPPPPADADGDGIADSIDVCTNAADPSQLDSDGDGIGNACDADLDNDGTVTRSDLQIWVQCYLAGLAARPDCAASDFDGDGEITMQDYYDVYATSVGGPPGPSAADLAPQIDLFTPADGTIVNTATHQAWVAGWVPNVAPGDVDLTVNGVPVAVSGSENYFSTFVDLNYFATFVDLPTPPIEASVFHPIVVKAMRGGFEDVERRVVLVGDKVRVGGRAHGALGARLTDEGLARIQQYLQTVVAQDVFEKAPEQIDGYRYDYDCADLGGVVALPICWSGYEISNAQLSGPPLITVAFESGGIHVHASLAQLTFDWEVDIDGPNCGEDTTVQNIEIDARYQLVLAQGGRVEVRELQDPVVDADIDVDGCWGGGHGAIESGIRKALKDLVHDPDGDGSQTSPVGKKIEDVFRSLDVSGTVDLSLGDDAGPVFDPTADPVATTARFAGPVRPDAATSIALAYDSRFESLVEDAQGVSVWLGAAVDAAPAVEGLGGPDGAYQIPYASVPALPNALVSGEPFHVAAAVTPNGLNEILDALTRTGFLARQAFTMTEVDLGNGNPIPITAGVLRLLVTAFGTAYPPTEHFSVSVSPSSIAPVVSGRKGPGDESLDVQLAQAKVEFVDESGTVALGLRVDARIGVDVGLGTSGSGSLTATARKIELLDFALVENPIGADPQQVFNKILCVDADPSQPFSCAIAGVLTNGLDKILATVPLPSLENDTSTEPGLELAPKCLQRLDDGTIVAEFGLLLPGEEPTSGPFNHFNIECMAPISTDTGGEIGGGTTVGGTTGTIGTVGTVAIDPSPPPTTKLDLGTVSTSIIRP